MTQEREPALDQPRAPRRRRNHAVWIGAALTFAGAVSYFLVFARFAVLRDVPWVNLPLVLLGVLLSALGLWRAFRRPEVFGGKILGGLGLIFSLLVAAAFNLYVFKITYALPAPTDVTLSMKMAPEFTLRDQTGAPVRLSGFLGTKLVLTFYRGDW